MIFFILHLSHALDTRFRMGLSSIDGAFDEAESWVVITRHLSTSMLTAKKKQRHHRVNKFDVENGQLLCFDSVHDLLAKIDLIGAEHVRSAT